MELSIIIVNWNSKDYLRKCVQSIHATTHGLEYEIVVIDGASYDGCGEMLAKEFPTVKFIQCDKNVGFARANNLAFEQSRGEFVLFLNPDTEVRGDAIKTLRQALDQINGIGMVGAKLLNTDGSLQTSAVQSFPTILNQFLDAEPLRRAFPLLPLWGIAPLYGDDSKPLPAEVLSGACLMMRREVFQKVGRFSEDYFMYAEDLDLCYKISKLGLENCYVPAAVIVHHGGGSTKQGRSTFSDVMMRESVYRFLRKMRGGLYAWGFRSSTCVGAMGRLLLLMLILPIRYLTGQPGRAFMAGRKWIAILKWAIGLAPGVPNHS